MSVIRQRKGKLIRAGLIGSLLVLIPCIIIIVYLVITKQENKSNPLDNVVKKGQKMYQVIGELSKDDEISIRDLEPIFLIQEQVNNDINNGVTQDVLDLNDIVGKRCRITLTPGTIISKDLIYKGEKIKNDLRRHKYTFIKLTEKIKIGSYVDIRISFANGSDFVLLSKKKVLDLSLYNVESNTENALWIEISAEEILRLSSAAVDAFTQTGCSIYAIEYITETQESSISNYPVNEIVSKLIETDPNIITRATNVLESRFREELNLESIKDDFETQSINTELNSKIRKTSEKVLDTQLEANNKDEYFEYMESNDQNNNTDFHNEIEYID